MCWQVEFQFNLSMTELTDAFVEEGYEIAAVLNPQHDGVLNLLVSDFVPGQAFIDAKDKHAI